MTPRSEQKRRNLGGISYKSSRAHKRRLMTGRKLAVEKPAVWAQGRGLQGKKNSYREEKENRMR